jgi:hypothetical protein
MCKHSSVLSDIIKLTVTKHELQITKVMERAVNKSRHTHHSHVTVQGSHPEILINVYQTTWYKTPKDSYLHTCCHENLKSYATYLHTADNSGT